MTAKAGSQAVRSATQLGFAVGEATADAAWYALEASARQGVSWSLSATRPR